MTIEPSAKGQPPVQAKAKHGPSPRICACPLCHSRNCKTVYYLKGYDIARCSQCGFEFNAHFRGGGDEGETFNKDYLFSQHRNAYGAYAEDYRGDPSVPAYERGLDLIESHVARGSLLDVGPGLGTFLRLASERGWNAKGIDISRFAIRHIKETHGIEMFQGNLHEFDCQEERFDLITFWDSIEHVPDPRRDLEHAWRLLRPGG